MNKHVLSIVGARPNFIKAAPISLAFRKQGIREVLLHTGQHYDASMSDVFFQALGIPEPAYNLGVGSARHGAQTGRMLERVEGVLLEEEPAFVVVYGDTNSTLAGALAAAKLNIPIGHVEAGLRGYDRTVPEETNRLLTDHMSSLLFAPTPSAVENLAREGILDGVLLVGDVMYDTAVLFQKEVSSLAAAVPEKYGVTPEEYIFVTLHRAENTDDIEKWRSVLEGIRRVANEIGPVVWSAHPRTRSLVEKVRDARIRLVDPLPYFETQALLMNAKIVLTDSGGLQKEAAFQGTPCVTLRDETPWIELLESGVNRLSGTNSEDIFSAAQAAEWPEAGLPEGVYGDGNSSERIVQEICERLR